MPVHRRSAVGWDGGKLVVVFEYTVASVEG